MATGTNGIATISDCNGIVSSAFDTYGRSISGTITGSKTINSGYYKLGLDTFNISGSTAYSMIQGPITIDITVSLVSLNLSSASGTSLNYSGTNPVIRLGLSTGTVNAFTHYKDVSPGTTTTWAIPSGTWYLRAGTNTMGDVKLTNKSTGAAVNSGTVYQKWQVATSIGNRAGYCPTYSEINGTSKFKIGGSYSSNQCVKYSDLSKMVGKVILTVNNTSSNPGGFFYTGNDSYSGTSYMDFMTFWSSHEVMGEYYHQSANVWHLYPASNALNKNLFDTWKSGYYYFYHHPSSTVYYYFYLNSSQAATLNNGTDISLSASGTTLVF